MADKQHLRILKRSVMDWNTWRMKKTNIRPDFSSADLSHSNLSIAILNGADLNGSDLSSTNLNEAILSYATLRGADLIHAKLIHADFSYANLSGAHLSHADLSDARLNVADLSYADLSDANLSYANLSYADLSGANLSNVNLSGANLSHANLSHTNLGDANLSGANLSHANLGDANLSDANLSNAIIGWTSFGDRNLREIVGLDTIKHTGPSSLSINTLYRSEGNIPETFIRGTGAPDGFIEYMHALAAKPIQYYTCFISYSSKNQEFAKRLYADLQANNVRCWYAPEDLKWGARTQQGIDEAIHIYDKLLLILSKQAITSGWVEQEVVTAMKREKKEKRTVLFPVRIDNAIDACPFDWASKIRRECNIGNFTGWRKSHDSYQEAFQRLLRDLKADTPQQSN